MDQNYNNSQNDFLWTLLANPADDAYQYNYNLQRLVNDFPQSGILQALLAHSSEEKNLRQASAYFNAKSLYKLINAPSSFIGVSDEKIIVQNGSRPAHINEYLDTNNGNAANYFSDNTRVEAATEEPHEAAAPVFEEHHTADLEAVSPVESNIEDLPAEEYIVPSYEHQPLNDIPVVEQGVNDIADTLPVNDIPVVEQAVDPIAETLVENHESRLSEVKNEVVNDVPVAEPIVNYAFGLGHRLPPEPEETGEVPPLPQAEEHGTSGHEIAPDVSYEHSVEENINEAHLPPPVPVEALVQEHPADSELPPPVPAEHAIADPVAAEYKGFEEPQGHLQEEAPVSDNFAAGNDEPVQQYRPWDEPELETQQPETKEEPVEEYKPWEEAATTYEQAEAKDEYTEASQPAEEHKPWEESPAAYHQPEAKEEHIEAAQPAEEPQSWEAARTEAHHAEVNADNHNIEDETFDEITGIENIDLEQDIVSNIAATDYFGFDRAFGEHKEPEPVKQSTATATEPVNEQPGDAEQQDLSKYHDEKMPYSFLWWLDKTRKEHSGVYQPYVPSAKESATERTARPKPGTDELQQQYYENIFHITSVEELDKSVPQPPYAAPAFSEKKKEQLIIERFIQEEPQIRPQSSDKLDNENKAKKSSEDRDELVSETLAAIYSDQMLYHKAIASYKKLILKFPEKSRYFAAKIEQLEKKTN